MLAVESKWIKMILDRFPPEEVSPVLNVGSSTEHFRKHVQAHIDRNVFAPLRARKCAVVHLDLKAADGVDVVGDLTEPVFQARMKSQAVRLVMCSNLLEHIPDEHRTTLCHAISEVILPGGYLLVTVPQSYPYHPDPIDTMFRPAPGELAAYFPGLDVVEAQLVQRRSTNGRDLARRAAGLGLNLLRGAVPVWWGPAAAEARHHRASIRHWLRPYSVSCVLMRKQDS